MSIRNELLEKILAATGGASGMQEAPTDTVYTARGDQWVELSDSVPFNYFKWSNDTVNPPGAGEISGNATDLANITELRVSASTATLIDVAFILSPIRATNAISLTKDQVTTAFGNFTVTGPAVDNLLYYSIPVISRGAGANFGEDSDIIFDLYSFNNKAHFLATSTDTVPIGIDPANPSFLGPLTLDKSEGFTLVDAATGAIRNDSGRTLDLVVGTINFTPNKTGGGTTTVDLVSERAMDIAGPWTGNLNSLRPLEIANNGESFQTKLSVAGDWLPGEIIRFRMYAVSGGSINFESVSRTILGQSFVSPSIAWSLEES